MEQVNVICIETSVTKKADVLYISHNSLKVAIMGTNFTIVLSKKGKVFVGTFAGLSFESNGVII
jgi:hypothetical protein